MGGKTANKNGAQAGTLALHDKAIMAMAMEREGYGTRATPLTCAGCVRTA